MDIYERLKQDHEKQRALGKKILETQGASQARKALWHDYKVELEAHASAEEQTLYAELMVHPEATDQSRHSVCLPLKVPGFPKIRVSISLSPAWPPSPATILADSITNGSPPPG